VRGQRKRTLTNSIRGELNARGKRLQVESEALLISKGKSREGGKDEK